MREPIRNQRQEIIGWIDRWSDTREILTDKNGKRLGVFEADTGTTRDGHGKIVGYGGNQLLRLLDRA